MPIYLNGGPYHCKTELEMHRIEALWSLSQMQILFWIAMLLFSSRLTCRLCDFNCFQGRQMDKTDLLNPAAHVCAG